MRSVLSRVGARVAQEGELGVGLRLVLVLIVELDEGRDQLPLLLIGQLDHLVERLEAVALLKLGLDVVRVVPVRLLAAGPSADGRQTEAPLPAGKEIN